MRSRRIRSLIALTLAVFAASERSKLRRIARDLTVADSTSKEAIKTGMRRPSSERAKGTTTRAPPEIINVPYDTVSSSLTEFSQFLTTALALGFRKRTFVRP
jgi:hypothetical protein